MPETPREKFLRNHQEEASRLRAMAKQTNHAVDAFILQSKADDLDKIMHAAVWMTDEQFNELNESLQ